MLISALAIAKAAILRESSLNKRIDELRDFDRRTAESERSRGYRRSNGEQGHSYRALSFARPCHGRNRLIHFPYALARTSIREAADDRLPGPRCAAGFRLEQNALVPVLDDELSAGLPSMGRPERLRKNDLTLCRQFRRLIHGKIAGKMIAGFQKSSKLGSGALDRSACPILTLL